MTNIFKTCVLYELVKILQQEPDMDVGEALKLAEKIVEEDEHEAPTEDVSTL